MGHERSADFGNLRWKGEDINHQWGKSVYADRLLNSYIKRHFISNIEYFSILKQIHDPLIFGTMAILANSESIRRTHSCNIAKPWCKTCAKCAYVFLGYQAFIDDEPLLAQIFDNQNLFNMTENVGHYEMMLGLKEHTPFECIGSVDEAKLCFELCYRKGKAGRAIDIYLNRARVTEPTEWRRIIDTYFKVYSEADQGGLTLPPALQATVTPILKENAIRVQAYFTNHLNFTNF